MYVIWICIQQYDGQKFVYENIYQCHKTNSYKSYWSFLVKKQKYMNV